MYWWRVVCRYGRAEFPNNPWVSLYKWELLLKMLRFLSDRDEVIAGTRRQRDDVNQELSQVETKINLVQDSVKRKKQETQGSQAFF